MRLGSGEGESVESPHLEAIRSILVYAGSAAAALWLTRRFLRRISWPAAVALALLPLLLTGRAVVTGGFYGPLNLAYDSAPLSARAGAVPGGGPTSYRDEILSDLAFQILPWQKAVREAVKHGRVPLWNPFLLSGDILLAAAQPAPFHPNTWIGFLLPLCAAWTFGRAFTFFLAGLFGWLYLREIGVPDRAALFGALAWSLSFFMIFQVGWPLSSAFVPLPLLLLGLRRLGRGEPGGFGATLVSLVLALLAGHPESVLHVVSAGGVVFLFDLARCRARGRAVGLAVAAGVLSLGLAAPAVLPFVEAAPQTMQSAIRRAFYRHEGKSRGPAEFLRAATGAVFPRSYGRALDLSVDSPPGFGDASQAYVGGTALALAMLGLFSRRPEKWALSFLAALAFCIVIGVPGVTDAVSRLPLFDISLNGRLAGACAFCLAALSALGLERLLEKEHRGAALFLLGVGLLLLAAGLLRRALLAPRPAVLPGFEEGLAMLVAPVLLLAAAGFAFRRQPDGLALAAFALFLLFHLAESPRLYPSFPSRLFYPEIPEFRRLPAAGGPYRTAGVSNDLVPNQSALYGLEDPRGYEAMTNLRYLETYSIWCVNQWISFNRIDDASRPFLSLLNVRFVVASPGARPPAGWSEWARGPNCAIFENPKALPRAFAPRRIRFVEDRSGTVEQMGRCSDFSEIGWIEDPGRPSGESRNGAASVTTREIGTDLELSIDAASQAWIVVSETNWKGWHAREGSRDLPIVFADHAFVGFRVPAGHHLVRLLYRPRSFELGIAVAAGSLLVLAGIGWRRRKNGSPSDAKAERPRSSVSEG